MEKYCVSRELAERLRDAGYPQNTKFAYQGNRLSWQSDLDELWLAAPISDELLEQLSAGTGVVKMGGMIAYNRRHGRQAKADRPADALALLWLWCKESGHLADTGKEAV